MSGAAVWITGASGFVGRHLLGDLAANGVRAAALVPEREWIPAEVPVLELDLAELALSDPWDDTLRLDALPAPSGLIHLAALSWPPACEADPPLARSLNVVGPARLYEQVLRRWPELHVLHVSSGQVYGAQAEPAREDQPLEPANVYGATKLQGEAVALGLRDRGHRVTVLRPFNHSGPGQSPQFALPSFALRLADLERQGGGRLHVGRLRSVRDFLHVAQVVAAYRELLPRAGEQDVVNVCSGSGIRIGELLDGLIERIEAPVEVEVEAARLRDGDLDALVGDSGRLSTLLGGAPELDAGRLLDELLADARARVSRGESLAGA